MIGDPADTTRVSTAHAVRFADGQHGIASLAARLPGRVLVLVDPRTGRSVRRSHRSGYRRRARADLHAVIADLGLAPVDAFAPSGGALNALALVAAHPTDVRVLVAHEPPLAALLPDAAAIGAACDAMVAAHDAEGFGPRWRGSLGLVMHLGEVVTGDEPTVDPTMFGFPTDDDGSRDDPLMANMRGGGVTQSPDLDALRAPTRIVAAVGEESGGATTGRSPPPRPRRRARRRGHGVPRRPRRLPRWRVRPDGQARRIRRGSWRCCRPAEPVRPPRLSGCVPASSSSGSSPCGRRRTSGTRTRCRSNATSWCRTSGSAAARSSTAPRPGGST
ncbi:MAG: hypothetical protein R2713_23630 [Ilumatobacteraceae bacterium]